MGWERWKDVLQVSHTLALRERNGERETEREGGRGGGGGGEVGQLWTNYYCWQLCSQELSIKSLDQSKQPISALCVVSKHTINSIQKQIRLLHSPLIKSIHKVIGRGLLFPECGIYEHLWPKCSNGIKTFIQDRCERATRAPWTRRHRTRRSRPPIGQFVIRGHALHERGPATGMAGGGGSDEGTIHKLIKELFIITKRMRIGN